VRYALEPISLEDVRCVILQTVGKRRADSGVILMIACSRSFTGLPLRNKNHESLSNRIVRIPKWRFDAVARLALREHLRNNTLVEVRRLERPQSGDVTAICCWKVTTLASLQADGAGRVPNCLP